MTGCLLLRTAILVVLSASLNRAASQQTASSRLVDTGCPSGTDWEAKGYRIRSARVVHPFSFLGWISRSLISADRIAAELDGTHYTQARMLEVRDQIEQIGFLPDFGEQRVRVRMIFVSIENCTGSDFDLVYRIYSSRFVPAFGASFESHKVESSAPHQAAGLAAPAPPRFRIAPYARYTASERFAAGGRLSVAFSSRIRDALGLETLTIDGAGSNQTRLLEAALRASRAFERVLSTAEWSVNYRNALQPARLPGSLRQARLALQFQAESQPVSAAAVTFRFGSQIEGGNYGGFAAAPGSGYGSAKLYGGASLRGDHQVFSSSYGVELGSLLLGSGIDWHKHVADIAHDWWLPTAKRRLFELESRFTAGALRNSREIPAPIRFFGGNREQFFIPGNAWEIRSTPVLRGVPFNRFAGDSGLGARSFAAFNLTSAYSVWSRPIVPTEIAADPSFQSQFQAQLNSAQTLLAAINQERDRHVALAVARTPALKQALEAVRARVSAGGTAAQPCLQAVNRAIRRLDQAASPEAAQRLALLQSVLAAAGGAGTLVAVEQACRETDSHVASAALEIQRLLDGIDTAGADRAAKREIAPARKALTTILEEMNLYSISPLLVFDAARLNNTGSHQVRYSIGAGIRFSFVSHVLVDFGYARNPHRANNEDSGALFFSLRVREMIR